MAAKEQNYVAIGYTKKAHGLSGELKVSIEAAYLEDFLKNERVFIAVKGTKIPYFIAQMRGKGELIVQFEELHDRDAAIMLQSKEIFLREEDLLADHERELEMEDDGLKYEHLTGYTIWEQTQGEIGVIGEVLDMPQQEMAFVRYKGREILIPLNENFITGIDDKVRMVRMSLPEGLLDM